MSQPPATHAKIDSRGNAREVFGVFLRLGLTCFGGPVAHLGYFREALVVRRRWVDEETYADLLALCQFLPGPASSQMGFCLGMLRCQSAGRSALLGGLAAWAGFTLPSALLMAACAMGLASLSGPVMVGAVHGLKLVAVAVVAQALWGMARSLAPDGVRAGIALAAVLALTFIGGPLVQLGAIAAGGLAGLVLCRQGAGASVGQLPRGLSRRWGAGLLGVFGLLLGTALLLPGNAWPALRLAAAFYRAGALVFGGGHVVLPLLQELVVTPGWVGGHSFLAGYGLAQAVPGPLFTFAAWLGAISTMGPGGWLGSGVALAAIFLPGLLLVAGMLPFWDGLRRQSGAQAAMRGANAAVVGVLTVAFYTPIWRASVLSAGDFALALAGFVALMAWRAPPWLVVVTLAAGGALAGWSGAGWSGLGA